jgi:hypothetical protein
MSGCFVRPEQNVKSKSLKPGHVEAPTKIVFVPTTINFEVAIAVKKGWNDFNKQGSKLSN